MASKQPSVAGEEGLRGFFWPFHLTYHLALWVVIVAFLSVVTAIGMAFSVHGGDGSTAYMRDLVDYYLSQAPNRDMAVAMGEKMESLVFDLPWLAKAASNFSAKGVTQAGDIIIDRRELVLVSMYALQLIGIRLMLLLFAVPALVLLLLTALVDGLVARYVRRECGGHESATRHMRSKQFLKRGIIPSIALVWLIMPLKLPFAGFFLPVATVMAILTWIMAKYFKKYL